MAAATPVTTTFTPTYGRKVACSFTLSTVAQSGNSGLFAFAVPKVFGTIVQVDVALAGSGVATMSVFSKDEVAAGSLYEILRVTGIAATFHAEFDEEFANFQTTPTNALYIIMTETGGAAATGAMTFIFWIEA